MRSPSSSDAALSRSSLVLCVILIGANLRAPITGVGPVLAEIQRDLGLGGVGAGLLNALPLLVFALLSMVAPASGRRYGLERTLAWALLAIVAGIVLRSAALPAAIWLGTLVLSAGIAYGNVLLPGLVKRHFADRAPLLFGLYAAAMAATAGVASGTTSLVADLPGSDWRWALGSWAVLAAVTLAAWLPQVRSRADGGDDRTPVHPVITAASPWRHAVGWQVALFFAAPSLVFYSLVDWFPTYALAHGIAAASAGVQLLVYQLVAVATNLGSAPLLQRLRDQSGLGLVCGLCLVLGTCGLLLWPEHSLAWLVLAGLGAGIAMVTSLSLFAFRTRNHEQAARLSGMAQVIGYAGAAMGPLLFGTLHDLSGDWTRPMLLLIAASGVVVVTGVLAGRRRTL